MQICAISTWRCSLDLRKRVSDGRETNQRRKSHLKGRIKMCMSASSPFRPSRTRVLLHVDVWNGGSTIQFRSKKTSEWWWRKKSKKKSHLEGRIKMCMSASPLFQLFVPRVFLHANPCNEHSALQFRPKKRSEWWWRNKSDYLADARLRHPWQEFLDHLPFLEAHHQNPLTVRDFRLM